MFGSNGVTEPKAAVKPYSTWVLEVSSVCQLIVAVVEPGWATMAEITGGVSSIIGPSAVEVVNTPGVTKPLPTFPLASMLMTL